MKKSLSLTSLLMAFALCGCTTPANTSSVQETSSQKEGPKDERIAAQVINDSYYRFYLPEFKEAFVSSNIQISSRLPSLSYGDTLISEGASGYFASDINGDGYRELIFKERRVLDHYFHVVVYDVKNAKRLFDQNNMTMEKYGYYTKYKNFDFSIRDDRLVLRVLNGGNRENDVVDYGRFKWSEGNNCSIEWENLFDVRSVVLEGVYTTNGHTKLHLDGGRKDDGEEIDLYSFDKDTSYQMEITVVRDDFTKYLDPGFLSMEWDSNESQTPTFYILERSCDPQTGKYVIEFSTSDIADFDLHDFALYFGFHGFSFYSKVLRG